METTEFSGAPQDDSRPDAPAPGSDTGFFSPAPAPTTTAQAETEPDPEPQTRVRGSSRTEYVPETRRRGCS